MYLLEVYGVDRKFQLLKSCLSWGGKHHDAKRGPERQIFFICILQYMYLENENYMFKIFHKAIMWDSNWITLVKQF